MLRWVGISFFFCPSTQSNFSCFHSSSHEWISSFALGSAPLVSIKLSMSSSFLSDMLPLPSASQLESGMSSSPSDPLPPLSSPTGDGPCEEGGYKEGTGNGAIDAARDGAADGTLNTTADMAGDGTLDDAMDMAGDSILEAAADTAGCGRADVEVEGDQDEWGMAVVTKNSVSLF